MHSESTPPFYVYVLRRPDGTPFYVGKGTGRRALRHGIEARRNCQCFKCRTIRRLWTAGQDLTVEIVFRTSDEAEAFRFEITLIEQLGRANLTNLTDGGEGAPANFVMSEESLARLHAKLLATCRTPESRAKKRSGALLRWASADERAAQSARMKQRCADPDVVAQKRRTALALWADPDYRARVTLATRQGRQGEAAKLNQRLGTLAAWERRRARTNRSDSRNASLL